MYPKRYEVANGMNIQESFIFIFDKPSLAG
jgi:hypothetical protein